MPFQSYAQNAEDVPLWRVFKDQPEGFYVDVGASWPKDSITTVFYERGWTGLNLEPAPHLVEELRAVRPRDKNLQIAVSNRSGTATLFTPPEAHLGGLSTIDTENTARLTEHGFSTNPIEVPMATLAEILAAHVDRTIDFLKIDVEGHEKAVIEGGDWNRWRPRILVIESIEPMSSIKSIHGEWEPILLNAGYLFSFFDGLNRFYLREEDRELLPLLSAPANCFDDYFPSKVGSYIKYLETTVAERSEKLHIADHERNHYKHVAATLEEHLRARDRQVQELSQDLHATASELQRFKGVKGVLRWAKHRTKLALGYGRRQAS